MSTSTSSTSTTGSTTFSGLATGLDSAAIIAAIIAADSVPLHKLEAKKTADTTLLSLYGTGKTKLTDIQTAAEAINSISGFRQIEGTSSDEDIFTVTATEYATAGTHTLKVNRLATAEVDVSQGYSSNNAGVGQGTFSFTCGDYSFSTTTTTDMTLSGLRDAINSADSGVTASIINDGDATSPYRLVLTADDTGKAINVTSNFTGGTPLAFTNGANEGDPGQQAQTAEIVMDGITIHKDSNEISGLIDGVTINLVSADSTTTETLKLTSNTSNIESKIQAFVTAVNAYHDWVKSGKSSGDLKNDSTLAGFDRSLRSTIATPIASLASAEYSTLSQVGLNYSSAGELQLDASDFEAALKDNFDGVMKLFAATGTTSGSDVSINSIGTTVKAGTYDYAVTGVGDAFAATIDGVAATTSGRSYFTGASGSDVEGLQLKFAGTAATSGTVTVTLGLMELINRQIDSFTKSDGQMDSRTSQINDDIDQLDRRISQKQVWLNKEQKRLQKQYTAMELAVSRLSAAASYLTALTSKS